MCSHGGIRVIIHRYFSYLERNKIRDFYHEIPEMLSTLFTVGKCKTLSAEEDK